VELKVPRVRDGGYFPSLLEPRRKAERGHWRRSSRKRTCMGSPRSGIIRASTKGQTRREAGAQSRGPPDKEVAGSPKE